MSRWTSFNPEFPEQHPSHGLLSRSLGRDEGFALHVRPNGIPVRCTFLGGSDADRASGVAADRDGDAHLAGRSLSADFPTQRPCQHNPNDQDYDAFVGVTE